MTHSENCSSRNFGAPCDCERDANQLAADALAQALGVGTYELAQTFARWAKAQAKDMTDGLDINGPAVLTLDELDEQYERVKAYHECALSALAAYDEANPVEDAE